MASLQGNTAGKAGGRVSVSRVAECSRLIGAEGTAPETVSCGRGCKMETGRGRTRAARESEYVTVLFPAGKAAGDQHGLMFIGFASAKPIQIGKCASVADRAVGVGVGIFCRQNSSHRRCDGRIGAKAYRRWPALGLHCHG